MTHLRNENNIISLLQSQRGLAFYFQLQQDCRRHIFCVKLMRTNGYIDNSSLLLIIIIVYWHHTLMYSKPFVCICEQAPCLLHMPRSATHTHTAGLPTWRVRSPHGECFSAMDLCSHSRCENAVDGCCAQHTTHHSCLPNLYLTPCSAPSSP